MEDKKTVFILLYHLHVHIDTRVYTQIIQNTLDTILQIHVSTVNCNAFLYKPQSSKTIS